MVYTVYSPFIFLRRVLMQERDYQAKLIKLLQREFPGIVILKNDSGYRQGIPDLTLLYEDRWAALEVKKHSSSSVRPNQEYYISKLNSMSFAAFISPDNEADILNELQIALQPS